MTLDEAKDAIMLHLERLDRADLIFVRTYAKATVRVASSLKRR
jgi:hypothetical protein